MSGAAPGIFGIAGIFTNPQFQVVIHALNQKKGVDLMSAPKVTTKSGRKAIVRVAREFPYPTEFNAPEPPPPSTGTTGTVILTPGTFTSLGVVTPSTPTAFETRNIGVTLEVEPIIGPDGYTIDLNLSPEVVEFDGFINYGSPIFGPLFVPPALIQDQVLTDNVINQPIFSTRKVTTSVSIWDGQTWPWEDWFVRTCKKFRTRCRFWVTYRWQGVFFVPTSIRKSSATSSSLSRRA